MDTKLDHHEAGVKDLSSKVEKKFDRIGGIESKIHYLVYVFLSGLALKGGFDFYFLKDVQKDFERKLAAVGKKISWRFGGWGIA
ncbi:Protein of unknown function [Pyronema omphalodes CBS 100304]|uniref:Uncharacterized protein n=1 Tax=Pyronema omphalodes (strain CBS 100304) TaxID=1076935 RepID=U4KWP6_PYROM|nr:Protein of unknown function [Pyronema omphalodes CBS 100304]